jgi:capsular polysaccharide export protein
LNSVAKNLNESCEIFYLSFFEFIKNIIYLFLRRDFWVWSYQGKKYYYYYRNNILKTFIRYPHIYKFAVFRTLLYLGYEFRVHLSKCLFDIKFNKKEPGTILIWNGAYFPHKFLIDYAQLNNFKTLYFEIGHFPNKIQVDPKGINYFSSLPNNPDFFLNYKFLENEILPTEIGQRKNKTIGDGTVIQKPKNYIFVVFQVPSDMQILTLSPWVKSMFHFYEIIFEMANKIPELNFVVKEHPSFKLKIFKKVKPHSRIIFDNWGNTRELIENSEAVLTVNSTAGLEGLVLGKKVITLGLANYNLKDLVLNAQNLDQLYHALLNIKVWTFDSRLREQFLKYYYHKYLITGAYANLTDYSLEKIKERSFFS